MRHVGLNEVHKAVGLLLETLGPPPTGLHLQRYDALTWGPSTGPWHLFSSILFYVYSRGIYREILFLTMAALGKDHVDIGKGAIRC